MKNCFYKKGDNLDLGKIHFKELGTVMDGVSDSEIKASVFARFQL
jgi:hypothetical protein